METKVITAHVPLPLADRIDKLAARLQRSRGWIMKQALEAWVDQAETGGKVVGFAEAPAKFEDFGKSDAVAAVAALKALREGTTLGEVSWRELRDAGRK
jgi:hypothetical protein